MLIFLIAAHGYNLYQINDEVDAKMKSVLNICLKYIGAVLFIFTLTANTYALDQATPLTTNSLLIEGKIESTNLSESKFVISDMVYSISPSTEVKYTDGKKTTIYSLKRGKQIKMEVEYVVRQDGAYDSIVRTIYIVK